MRQTRLTAFVKTLVTSFIITAIKWMNLKSDLMAEISTDMVTKWQNVGNSSGAAEKVPKTKQSKRNHGISVNHQERECWRVRACE